MLLTNTLPTVADLTALFARFWAVSGQKIQAIDRRFDPEAGAPVFTVAGKYTSRGWTDWTEGFAYGSALLQFEATDDEQFLHIGRERTRTRMTAHVSHTGVHDHGFNNISTYGALLRLMQTGRIPEQEWERAFYEQALKLSGAVQASRWTTLPEGGYIYSFNGPHSLFVDTVRTVRSLVMAHRLGHTLPAEQDRRISLLHRALYHMQATARYAVYYGTGRDAYDIRGRVAHESLFNVVSGTYRCPGTQQGYSPFSTWTRGLAWAMLGFAEQLDLLGDLPEADFTEVGDKATLLAEFRKAAEATCDFYLTYSPTDGIPYWDTGAPGLAQMGNYLDHPADPFNQHEPVDSSAAAIAAQGLLRLGQYVAQQGEQDAGERYVRAGIKVLHNLLREPYLSLDPAHEGLLLHSVYHRPNGWDYVPTGQHVPNGEACMWGDYHLREAVLLAQQIVGEPSGKLVETA
jgi:unsaturated chondroitin disaccharide hydrolase